MRFTIHGMLIALPILLLPFLGSSTTYYSKASGNANSISTWGTNTDGTGAEPLNFTTIGDVFILRTVSTLGLNGQWTIGGGVTLQVDGNISVTNNNHDINISGTIIFTNPNSTQISLTGGGNGNSFIVSAAATVKTANLNGLRGTNCSLPATVSGNISLNANANYEFTGSVAQLTTGLPTQVNDLVVNSSTEIILNTSTSLSGQLKLQNGILKILPGITLTVSSPNSIIGSAYGDSKHINTAISGSALGYLRINSINGNASFPIGNGTYYMPVSVTTSTTTDIRTNVFQGLTRNGIPDGPALSAADKVAVVDAVWTVEKMAGTGIVLMSLNWPQSLEGSRFSSFSNAEIGIAKNMGTYWDQPIGSGNQSANTATVSSLANLGKFGVGKIGIPLPMKFGGLKLTGGNGTVNVNWSSLSEFNVRHYLVERSSEGINFSVIGSVTARNNNSSANDYSLIDATPLYGNSFYRIRAIDLDGKGTLSAIVRMSTLSSSELDMTVYPNPVLSKEVTIQVGGLEKGLLHLYLFDMNGKEIFRQELKHSGGSVTQHIILPPSISAGLYNLSLEGTFGGMQRKIQVK